MPRASLLTTAGRSVGPAMVADRVNVAKSCIRTLTVTVRPDRRAFDSRSQTLRACRSMIAASSTGSTRSTSNVSSTDTDLVSRSATTGRSSSARAMA